METNFKPLIDWLTYRSYEANRIASPHVPDYKWRKLYQDAVIFEEIFEENKHRIIGNKNERSN